MKLISQREIYVLMFISALFMIVKIWKQPKCLSINKWINMYLSSIYLSIYLSIYHLSIVYQYTHTQRHDGILLSHEQEGNPALAAAWADVEGLRLSARSQAENYKYCMI